MPDAGQQHCAECLNPLTLDCSSSQRYSASCFKTHRGAVCAVAGLSSAVPAGRCRKLHRTRSNDPAGAATPQPATAPAESGGPRGTAGSTSPKVRKGCCWGNNHHDSLALYCSGWIGIEMLGINIQEVCSLPACWLYLKKPHAHASLMAHHGCLIAYAQPLLCEGVEHAALTGLGLLVACLQIMLFEL